MTGEEMDGSTGVEGGRGLDLVLDLVLAGGRAMAGWLPYLSSVSSLE